MRRITNLFLAALLGFSALPFVSCKSEIDKVGQAVDESKKIAREKTVPTGMIPLLFSK
jgi:hypothetical protein